MKQIGHLPILGLKLLPVQFYGVNNRGNTICSNGESHWTATLQLSNFFIQTHKTLQCP